jgi:hypothetical protein
VTTIFLDMDGVLADFNAALRARGVVDDQPEFHHKPKDEWTKDQIALDASVRACMESSDFWPSIPLMADAKALWKFCDRFDPNVYILTATPRETNFRSRIEKQKREWVDHHFGPFFENRVIVCAREYKKNYAGPNCVLVDDMAVNCREWFKAGGISIHHKSAQDSINYLSSLTPLRDKQPSLRDKTSAERKAEPIHSGVMLYFPDALAAVARISKAGNDKHNPGEPLHWARGKSMDQMDASARHMLTLDVVDPESGELEAAHNAWRALAQLQLLEEKRLAAAGVKAYSGIVP